MGESAGGVLMTVAASGRRVAAVEIGPVTGRSDDGVEAALRRLADWCLVNPFGQTDGVPAFDANQNTKRLVQKTFAASDEWRLIEAALRASAPDFRTTTKTAAIGSLIGQAVAFVLRGDPAQALLV